MKKNFFAVFLFLSCHGLIAQDVQATIVSAADYCQFLNDTAPTDVDHFYNQAMGLDSLAACIERIGVSGSYEYFVIAGRENFPITFITAEDQMAYCRCHANVLPSPISDNDMWLASNQLPFYAEKSDGNQTLALDHTTSSSLGKISPATIAEISLLLVVGGITIDETCGTHTISRGLGFRESSNKLTDRRPLLNNQRARVSYGAVAKVTGVEEGSLNQRERPACKKLTSGQEGEMNMAMDKQKEAEKLFLNTVVARKPLLMEEVASKIYQKVVQGTEKEEKDFTSTIEYFDLEIEKSLNFVFRFIEIKKQLVGTTPMPSALSVDQQEQLLRSSSEMLAGKKSDYQPIRETSVQPQLEDASVAVKKFSDDMRGNNGFYKSFNQRVEASSALRSQHEEKIKKLTTELKAAEEDFKKVAGLLSYVIDKQVDRITSSAEAKTSSWIDWLQPSVDNFIIERGEIEQKVAFNYEKEEYGKKIQETQQALNQLTSEKEKLAQQDKLALESLEEILAPMSQALQALEGAWENLRIAEGQYRDDFSSSASFLNRSKSLFSNSSADSLVKAWQRLDFTKEEYINSLRASRESLVELFNEAGSMERKLEKENPVDVLMRHSGHDDSQEGSMLSRLWNSVSQKFQSLYAEL